MEDHEAFVSLGEIFEADRHRQVGGGGGGGGMVVAALFLVYVLITSHLLGNTISCMA